MVAIRIEEAHKEFEAAITASRDDVERAKPFLMERTGPDFSDSTLLIRQWWAYCKAPPIQELVLHEEYDYPDQCLRAGRHWAVRLSAARAIHELVKDGFLEAGGSENTERVTQGYTTVVERSGGTSGGWSLDRFDVQFPRSVRRGPFSREWTEPVTASATIPVDNRSPEIAEAITSALAYPSWVPLETRAIGETHDTGWYAELPVGLPQIVVSAAARKKAIDDLRAVADSLTEAAPVSPLERRIAEHVRASLDSLIDLLSLNDAAGWAATEEQGVPMARDIISHIVLLTRLVEGLVGWAEAVELLKKGLRAIGFELP